MILQTAVAQSVNLNTIVRASEDQVSCDLSGEEVILDLRSGIYYGLDTVGARIWRLMQSPISIAVIRDTMMSEYEVDLEQCESDLLEFLGMMSDRGLVVIES